MDDSILAMFPDDDHVLGPFLGNLPPEVRRRNPLAPLAPLAVAVVEGDVEALGWLIQLFDGKRLNWRADDFGSKLLPWLAIRRGKIDSLTCLRANGCPWDEHTCTIAARRGHLEVLQWLRHIGCPWNEWTCAAAANGGHLEVLQWAHQNGCRCDLMTCEAAAKGRRVITGARGTRGRARPRPREAT